MSITEIRLTPDKSGKDAVVCDVAIHSQFFRKVEAQFIFRDFLVTIIFEALDTKYNIQIDRDTWIILKNRKCMGTLVKHRVQNRDIQKVYESYQNPTKVHKTLINELKSDGVEHKSISLITEIAPRLSKPLENGKGSHTLSESVFKTPMAVTTKPTPSPIYKSVDINDKRKPEYRLFKTSNGQASATVIAEFFLPAVTQSHDITLALSSDRIYVLAANAGYLIDTLFPCKVDAEQAKADYSKLKHVSSSFRK